MAKLIRQKHNKAYVVDFTKSGKVVTTKTKSEAKEFSDEEAPGLLAKYGDQFESAEVK